MTTYLHSLSIDCVCMYSGVGVLFMAWHPTREGTNAAANSSPFISKVSTALNPTLKPSRPASGGAGVDSQLEPTMELVAELLSYNRHAPDLQTPQAPLVLMHLPGTVWH